MNKFLLKIGSRASFFAERFVPDAWIYAILLTFVSFFAASIFTPSTPWEVAVAWQNGFWNPDILKLIAQFSLILLLGTALAQTPGVRKILTFLAKQPRSPRQSIWLIGSVSILLSLISWALCIVGGALFAKEVCRQASKRKIKLHYPLAIASGYVGMLTWGCGLTSSAALISSTPGHFMEKTIGILPISATLLSLPNVTILVILFFFSPLILAGMHPSDREAIPFAPPREKKNGASDTRKTFADWIETSPAILKLAALLPLSFLINYYFIEKKGLTIDSMNLIFLVAIMLLYKNPRDMLTQIHEASNAVWSIIFQFPFYAGLMGLIKTTGLGLLIANFFVEFATPWTWPTLGISFQGLLNLFIPSGGSQWLVSGEILVRTSEALGFSHAHAVLIEIMGDQLTNMIQPMWALPALALSGLHAKNIMGYTAVVMGFAFAIMSAGLTFLSP